MKLKTYPGYAIDANFTVSKFNHDRTHESKSSSTMGVLYEANWIATGEKIQLSPASTSLKCFQPEQHNAPIMKHLNGPTLRIKRDLKIYDEWDCDTTKQNTQMLNPLYNHTQNNWHSSDYLTDLNGKNTDSKIRRSHTVVVKQPTSSVDIKNHGKISFRDFYQNKNKQKSTHENHNNNQYSKNISFDEERVEKRDDIKNDCDTYKKYSINTTKRRQYLLGKKSDVSQSNSTDAESVSSRMNSYQSMNFYASNENYDDLLKNKNFANNTSSTPSKFLLNPLAQNKSIKINHFDMTSSSGGKESQKLKENEVDGKLCTDIDKNVKKEKKSNFSKMFYNTISAGSKLPKVFLGRSKSQRSKLNFTEFKEVLEEKNVNSETSRNLSSSSTSTLSTASPVSFKNCTVDSNSNQQKQIPNSDSFVIPRPRLKITNDSSKFNAYAVPVHTYARKRRTGNIIKDQGMATTKNNKSDNSYKQKGKMLSTYNNNIPIMKCLLFQK